MNLRFENPGLEYNLDSIMPFHDGAHSEKWQASLFHFFPQLDREAFAALPGAERRNCLRKALRPVYEKEAGAIAEKTTQYNAYWQEHRAQVTEAFPARSSRI